MVFSVTSLKVSIIIVWGLRLGYSSGQQIGNYCNLMTLGISIMNKNNFIVQEAKRLMGLEVHRNGVENWKGYFPRIMKCCGLIKMETNINLMDQLEESLETTYYYILK